MQFLRTLFWVVLAVIAVVFATRNWTTVPVNLSGGLVADVKLPVLLGGAFLLGLVPPMILYRATRWRLRRRLEQAQRTLAARDGMEAAPTPAPAMPAPIEAQPAPVQTPVAP